MTPLDLQDALCDEIKTILSHYRYKTPAGERAEINVFPQNLPVNESDDDDDPVPYVIVRLTDGKDKGERESFNVVSTVVIIGLWNDALDNQGHREVMNIIQKIYERFHKNPNLKNLAAYTGEFNWANQEDGYYPYFFGACTMDFNIAAIRREDPFS